MTEAITHAELTRPKTRGECERGPRPCPWVSCRYHLYGDVRLSPVGRGQETLSYKPVWPDKEPWELSETCALDMADDGPWKLDALGDVLNVSRARIGQMETRACAKAIDRARSQQADEAVVNLFAASATGRRDLEINQLGRTPRATWDDYNAAYPLPPTPLEQLEALAEEAAELLSAHRRRWVREDTEQMNDKRKLTEAEIVKIKELGSTANVSRALGLKGHELYDAMGSRRSPLDLKLIARLEALTPEQVDSFHAQVPAPKVKPASVVKADKPTKPSEPSGPLRTQPSPDTALKVLALYIEGDETERAVIRALLALGGWL